MNRNRNENKHSLNRGEDKWKRDVGEEEVRGKATERYIK